MDALDPGLAESVSGLKKINEPALITYMRAVRSSTVMVSEKIMALIKEVDV